MPVVGVGSQVFEHGFPDDPTPYTLTATVTAAEVAAGSQSGDVILFVVRTLWPNPHPGSPAPSGVTAISAGTGPLVQSGALVPKLALYSAPFDALPVTFTVTAAPFTAVRSQSMIVDTVTLRRVGAVSSLGPAGGNSGQFTDWGGGTYGPLAGPSLVVDVVAGLNVPLTPDTPPSINTANGFTLAGSATTPVLMVNPTTGNLTEGEFGWFPVAVAAAEVPAGSVTVPTWDFPGSDFGDDRTFHGVVAFAAGRHLRGISVTQGGTGFIRG